MWFRHLGSNRGVAACNRKGWFWSRLSKPSMENANALLSVGALTTPPSSRSHQASQQQSLSLPSTKTPNSKSSISLVSIEELLTNPFFFFCSFSFLLSSEAPFGFCRGGTQFLLSRCPGSWTYVGCEVFWNSEALCGTVRSTEQTGRNMLFCLACHAEMHHSLLPKFLTAIL